MDERALSELLPSLTPSGVVPTLRLDADVVVADTSYYGDITNMALALRTPWEGRRVS